MRIVVLVPNDNAISRLGVFAKSIFSINGHDTFLVSHSPETLVGNFCARFKRVGIWRALDEAAYSLFEGAVFPWENALADFGLISPASFDANTIDTSSVEFENLLNQLSADLLVAIGCIPINIKTFPVGLVALNIHPGILPGYRGVGSPEAVIINRPLDVGYTIHRLTHQLDEGEIFIRKRSVLEGGLNIPKLYIACYLSAIETLSINLDSVRNAIWPVYDDFVFQTPEVKSPFWRLKISDFLIYKVREFYRSTFNKY